MADYLALREALRGYLDKELDIPVSLHSGSFAAADVQQLRLHQGDELLIAFTGARQGRAEFQLYLKTRHLDGIDADVRALALILLTQKALHTWKDDLIAKRVTSDWQMLPDNKLADLNVYIYRITANVAICADDYLEDTNGN